MRAPPTGTVTFLFTDIEGSTKLWQDQPRAMQNALARHDALLRQAVEMHDGYLVKTTGDGVHAAFATASDALAAALAAQCALQTEPWDLKAPISVRMGLHTGSAEEREGDYYGNVLNRTARLLAAAHGGQALVSAATQELARDHLPPEAGLRDLGEASLKDLSRPERVFQLLHPALAADFPPLRSLDNPALPNNLPQQLTSFIGREKELTEITALLVRMRLLTLTGTGGSGKTRLSLQVAADVLDQYEGGVWLIKLASLTDPALVPQTVADALGVREEAGKPSMRTLVDWLRPRRLLLILDNCEHLIIACATLAADLLKECPEVYLLASSREPLGVAGEQIYRVPSLSLPDPKKNVTAAALSQYEAVFLFIERARAVRPDFAVTDANAPAVAQVCFRLDGIPLAIELAAVRVRSLSVEDINARLDNRFRLLTGGARDILPRQQTLRALIDWSYDLLTEQEKTLLRRLSVFAGGWTLAAAEVVGLEEAAVGGIIEDWEVLDLLASLVDKSLVVYEEGEGRGARYRLLETIHHYSQERLTENGEETAARQRHLDFFLAFAEEAESQLLDEYQQDCVKRLQAEADNLRAALTQSQSDTQAALRLAGALKTYWNFTNLVREGRVHIAAALSLPGAGERTAARAKALIGAAGMCDLVESRSCFEEGLSIARERGDALLTVWALLGVGDTASSQGDYQEADDLLAESLALCRAAGYWPGTLWALNYQGVTALRQGRAAEARECWERAVAAAREGHLDSRICWTLNSLANLNRDEGRQGQALALAKESLTLVRAAGIKPDFSWTAEIVADLHSDLGEFGEARGLLAEAEAFRKAEGWDEYIQPQILMVRACLGLGEYEAAQAYLDLSLGMVVSEEEDDLAGWLRQYQGNVALGCQEKNKARLFYRSSLCLFWKRQDMAGIFLALSGLSATEEAERSARLHGAAQALSQTEERVRRILKPHERQRQMYENEAAVSRIALGEASFAATWDAGYAMTLEQAVEYALGETN